MGTWWQHAACEVALDELHLQGDLDGEKETKLLHIGGDGRPSASLLMEALSKIGEIYGFWFEKRRGVTATVRACLKP
jgi:hypothetical protein